MPSPDLAERVWWERVARAAKRKGAAGAKVSADWAHDVLELIATDEAQAGAQSLNRLGEPAVRSLNDTLGRRLGVGPMPENG